MSSILSFIPRKVAKSAGNQGGRKVSTNEISRVNRNIAETTCQTPRPETRTTSVVPNRTEKTQEEVKGKGKARADERGGQGSKFTEVDYAHLVCLALSDYALWLDPDLRRALDPTQKNKEEEWSGEAGPAYIPINWVFQRFPACFGIDYPPPTSVVAIVKALRACAAELVDTRLLLEEPPLAFDGWQGENTHRMLGGYELRRKDWTRENVPGEFSYSKRDWDDRTIYVEHVPVQYRNVPGILRITTSLLAENPASHHSLTRIQGVILPAHLRDKPGDPPTFKDFCLVTFTALEDAEFLTNQWPWVATKSTDKIMAETKQELEAVKEASKFGFRTLTKRRWEQLRQEYLNYRMKLIKEINGYEDAQAETQMSQKRFRDEVTPEHTPPAEDNVHPSPKAETLSPDAPYPYGCLVFVRNIHQETNKTTLRTLFSSAFKGETKGGLEDGLDYVDFNKGMDACHLRLSTPMHADVLVCHFTKDSIIQAHGLDDKGTPVDASSVAKPMLLEKVLGKREEIYWERVPEKVRGQAVQKAITLTGVGVNTVKDLSEANTEPQRKRERKG